MKLIELSLVVADAARKTPYATVVIEDLRTGFAENADNAYLSSDGYFYIQKGEDEDEDDDEA